MGKRKTPTPEPEPETDLLWGAIAIGKVMGRSPVTAHSMLAKGLLPARKVGRRYVISRQRLVEFLSGEEAA